MTPREFLHAPETDFQHRLLAVEFSLSNHCPYPIGTCQILLLASVATTLPILASSRSKSPYGIEKVPEGGFEGSEVKFWSDEE